MKTINRILFILFVITVISCKAQSIIVPIGSGDSFEKDPNYYLKDVNNEFGKFEGTWKYQNGNNSITFKLKKEEHYQASDDYNYIDLLVGEYQFIENGIEKANTLSDIDNTEISGYDHKISGRVFTHQLQSNCVDNSDINEIKIELLIENPNDDLVVGTVVLRYVNDNGVEKLEVCIYDNTTLADDENARIVIPDGYYEFDKIE